MRKTMLFLGGLICVAVAWAQDYQKTAYGIKTTVNDVDVEVQFFTPSVVRLSSRLMERIMRRRACRLWLHPKKWGLR